MLEGIKIFAAWLVLLAAGFAAVFGLGYAGLQWTSYYSPKYEAVRNRTFHESQSYNDGMLRDLQDLRMDYVKADAAGKAVIRSVALQRFAAYDTDKLPSELREFYLQLQGN